MVVFNLRGMGLSIKNGLGIVAIYDMLHHGLTIKYRQYWVDNGCNMIIAIIVMVVKDILL